MSSPDSAARRRARKLRPRPGARHRRRFRETELRRRRRRGALFLGGHLIFGTVFLVWLGSSLNLEYWYITIPFMMAEIVAFVATTVYATTIRHPRLHRPEGPRGPAVARGLDVWICTAGEPLSVLEPTLAAAVRIHASSKRVYVLDDRGSPEVARLAAQYGAAYVAREETADAKAGNLNHALRATRDTGNELILALDADQVPDPELMRRVSGYFRFPRVAFVQTAQRFVLPSGDPFGNSDALFYCVMQTSKDADNAAFSCGSGVVYRREALEAIGGFSAWNVVEDVHTSMRLHAAGWTSIYHPFALSTGTAPADIVSFARQRKQWAIDSLRILFWDNPLRYRGLTPAQRVHYFYTGASYIVAGVVLPFYFLVPGIALLTHMELTTATASTYALYRGAYLLFTLMTVATLQRPIHGLRYFRMWAGTFPVHFMAALAALRARSSKPAYRVTSKVQGSPSVAERLRRVAPQIAVLLVVAVAVPYGWLARALPVDALVVNTAWSGWVAWSVTGVIGAALQSREPIRTPSAPTRAAS